MTTIYVTDGDPDTIIDGVGLTILDYTTPAGGDFSFGDIGEGFQRKTEVDLASLGGLLSGGGIIGYFSDQALAKPRPGAEVPLLVEMIAAGDRHDAVLPPLLRDSPGSLAGRAAPELLSLEEQQALFQRVLGKDWARKVERHLKRCRDAGDRPGSGAA